MAKFNPDRELCGYDAVVDIDTDGEEWTGLIDAEDFEEEDCADAFLHAEAIAADIDFSPESDEDEEGDFE